MEAVDFKKSAQLDLLVVPQVELHHILDVRSLRAEALASHHFLVLAPEHSPLGRRRVPKTGRA